MGKIEKAILKIAGLLFFLSIVFPPFRLSNGQPQWGFIGDPPWVVDWRTWDAILANNFQRAGIHWGFLVIEMAVIAVMALTIWVSINDTGHHQGH
jgi:hypothetical protein